RPVANQPLPVSAQGILLPHLRAAIHDRGPRGVAPVRELVEELARLLRVLGVAVPVRARDEQSAPGAGQRHVTGPAFLDDLLLLERLPELPEEAADVTQ